MIENRHFDFCVIGAGLAGLSVAGSLADENAKVLVIDKNEVGSGASGTPLGLVNPATGRYGTKTWMAEECVSSIASDLERVQNQAPAVFFKKTGILRPALDEKIASKMQENAKNSDWPENRCIWLDAKEITTMDKNINCHTGGLWLPNGITVNIHAYLQAKAAVLENSGVHFKTNSLAVVQKKDAYFEVDLGNNSKYLAERVVFTMGIEALNSDFRDFLPLIPIKGQLVKFKTDFTPPEFSISALGYLGTIEPGYFIAGSTYEHTFESAEPDEKGMKYIVGRLQKVYPKIFENAVPVKQWAGIRAGTPNRKPVIGEHPQIKNAFIFTGLGSKGMLYSSWLGKALCNHILNNTPLPHEVTLNKYL